MYPVANVYCETRHMERYLELGRPKSGLGGDLVGCMKAAGVAIKGGNVRRVAALRGVFGAQVHEDTAVCSRPQRPCSRDAST